MKNVLDGKVAVGIGARPLALGQDQKPQSFQLEQQGPAGHIFYLPPVIEPSPFQAQFPAQPSPVPTGIGPNQLSDLSYILLADRATLDDHEIFHGHLLSLIISVSPEKNHPSHLKLNRYHPNPFAP